MATNQNLETQHISELDRLLRISEVSTSCGLARSTIYLKLSQGKFPKPVNVGTQAVRWRHSDIQAWLDSLKTVEAL